MKARLIRIPNQVAVVPEVGRRRIQRLAILRHGGQHDAAVVLNSREKNALPEALVHSILKQWLITKWEVGYRDFLVLDSFAGWGSVKSALTTIRFTETELKDDLPDRYDLLMRSFVKTGLVSYVGFDITQHRLGKRKATMAELRLKRHPGDMQTVLTDTDYIIDYLNPDVNPIMSARRAPAPPRVPRSSMGVWGPALRRQHVHQVPPRHTGGPRLAHPPQARQAASLHTRH